MDKQETYERTLTQNPEGNDKKIDPCTACIEGVQKGITHCIESGCFDEQFFS